MNMNCHRLLFPLLAIIGICALCWPNHLRAQEAFAATHVCQLRTADGVPEADETVGLGIFQVDRQGLQAQFRITLAETNSPYTAVMLSRRVGEELLILQQFPWPTGNITSEGSFQLLDPIVLAMLDSGNIYLEVRTQNHPDTFLVGQIEEIPSALSPTFNKSEETDTVTSNGEGSAFLYYDKASNSVRYTVDWSWLTGPAVAAHFHRGAKGVDGPPVHALSFAPGDSVVNGVWQEITPDDLDALMTGNVYVNVHTQQYPNGEIRGQLMPLEFFAAAITPLNEVPPVTTSSASGTGVLAVVGTPEFEMYATATAVIGGTNDSVTAAHLHRGPADENGPVLRSVTGSSRTFYRTNPNVGGLNGISLAAVDSIRAGMGYINFHTVSFPDGELRGQWIAGLNNYSPTAPVSVPLSLQPRTAAMLSASNRGEMIHFTINEGMTRAYHIRLYSLLGVQMKSVEFTGAAADMDAAALPAGLYFAELSVDGVRMGSCRVVVGR
jgi:hypothetical protein